MDNETILEKMEDLIDQEVLIRGDKVNMEGFLYEWGLKNVWMVQNPFGNYKLEIEEISFVASNHINLVKNLRVNQTGSNDA